MGENATEAEMAAPLENGAAEVAAPPAAPPPVAIAAAPAVGGIAMVAMPLLQQTGEVFCGPGSRKEAQLLGLGLTKLRSRQKDALQDAKRYAMDISIKQIMMRQQEAHQKNQQKQAMYAQAISLMGRVYIGSISFEVREDMLRKAFECFGPIKSINLSYDNSTGLHKGFAFLEYDVPEAALLCQEAMNGVLMGGRNLKVGRPSNMPQAGPIIDMVQQEAKLYHRVYVSSVHPDLSESDLKSVFEAFGEVKKCQLARQGVTGKGSHRGFGYIEFTNAASANEAIAGMNMFDLGGQFLRVGRCITPPDALTAIVPQATVNLPNAAALAAAAVTAQIQATEIQKGATAGSQSPGQLAVTDGSQSPAATATPPPAAPSPVKAIAPAPVPPPPPQQLAIGGAPAPGTPPPPPGFGSPMHQQDPYVPPGYGQMAGGVAAPPPPAPVPPPPPPMGAGAGTPPSQSFGSPAAAAAAAPSRRSGFGGFAAAPPPGAVASVPPPGIVGGAAPPHPPVGVAGGSAEGEGGEPKMSAAAARRARKKESMLKGNVLDRIQLSSFDASAPAQFGVADPLTAPKDPLSDEAAMLMLEGGGKQSIEDVQSMALALLEGSGAVMNVKKKAEAAAAAALEAAGVSNANKQPRAKIKKPKAVKGPQLNTAQALAAAHTAGALSDAVVNATVNAEDATLASQEGMQIRGNDARHLLMTKLMRTNRSCVLLLKNMVAADEIDEYLEEEIKEETGKYGHVEEVIIAADEQSNSVKIFVRFAEAQQADAAKAALDNRFFGGKTISAAIYDQALFDHGDLTG